MGTSASAGAAVRRSAVFGAILVSGVLAASSAQAADVVTVKASQENPTLPHATHEGAPITLKAILRNAPCANGYDVTWDTNFDGDYSNDSTFAVTPGGQGRYWNGTYYDIGRTYTVPQVDRARTVPVGVRVQARGNCVEDDAFGTFLLFVYNWSPDADLTPNNRAARDYKYWPEEQLEVMILNMLQETMWWLHRRMDTRSGTDAGMHGALPSSSSANREISTAAALWLFTINGHLPGFPPGAHTDADLAGLDAPHIRTDPPLTIERWRELNDFRWRNDPYAETTARAANRIARIFSRTYGVGAAEETDSCGFNGPGQEIVNANGDEPCGAPIPGTNQGEVIYPNIPAHGCDSNSEGHTDMYRLGKLLGSIATVLPSLGGVQIKATAGSAQNQTWEWLVQEIVDGMTWAQIDRANDPDYGGWLYCANREPMDASTAQWGYIGLESAEVTGRQFGVNVNNRVKYRIAPAIVNNQSAGGGAAYRTGRNNNNYQLNGGALVGMRWLGVHQFPSAGADANVRPWEPYTSLTAGQMKQSYDRYLAHTIQHWYNGNAPCHSSCSSTSSWVSGLFRTGGDFLCNDFTGVYNQIATNNNPYCANHYGMYSFQKGFRTGTPEIGPDELGGIDWYQQLTTYYIRSQRRAMGDASGRGGNYDNFGRNTDQRARSTQLSGDNVSVAWGGLISTPTIFRANPIALADATPSQVVEGCSGAGAGVVNLQHSDSFHPAASANIVRIQWDVDDRNGLWWETGDDPDYEALAGDGVTPAQLLAEDFVFTYEFAGAGTYTATLRITDDSDPAQTDTGSVEVTVQEAENLPPTGSAGPDYTIETDGELRLAGNVSDPNTGCGDVPTSSWDLDLDGSFDDAFGPGAVVPWANLPAALQNAPRGEPQTIRMQVTDTSGEAAIYETTVTIYERDPVAVADFNPRPEPACNQQVDLLGGGSFHPNPNREIVQWDWDIGDDGSVERGNENDTFTFDAFGTYTVRLTVTDDLGRSNSTTMQIPVLSGNNRPVAQSLVAVYDLNEGDPLTLDGSPSSDDDVGCGDEIVAYRWDLNGNGVFNDPEDVTGETAEVPWDDLIAAGMVIVADRNTGLPNNTVTLQVEDTFGETATTDVTVRLFEALPRPVVRQVPLPATINVEQRTGTVTVDCLESFSPIPGNTITRCDWSLNGDDGVFERGDEASITFTRVLNDIPPAGQETTVRIALQVWDRDNRRASVVYDVRFRTPPTPPTADADPTQAPERGYHILLGDDLNLDGSQSLDPDPGDCIRFYRWAVNVPDVDLAVPFAAQGLDDANPNVFVSQLAGDDCDDADAAVTTLTAAQLAAVGVDAEAQYEVVLEVEDLTGETARDAAELFVYDRLPRVSAIANPNPAACPGTSRLDGSASDHPHPDFDVVDWAWDFDGDGDFGDAQGGVVNVIHEAFTFPGDAPRTITLRVTDNLGQTNDFALEVPVTEGNEAPVADGRPGPGNLYAMAVGDTLTLDASDSSDPNADCGDEVVAWEWDILNDGDFDGAGAQLALDWAALGSQGINATGDFPVRVRVTDRFGATAEQLVTVRVVNGPTAVAVAIPENVNCNAPAIFDGRGSFTDGPAGQGFELVSWEWDFDGDGNFETPGDRVIRPADRRNGITGVLRVTDASGRTDTDEVTVSVNVFNAPPTADAGGPYATGRAAGGFAPVELDGRASSDPNAPCDEVAEYRWFLDGDDVPDVVNAVGTVSYTNPNWQVGQVQLVRLVVCDQFGACSPESEATITIEEEAPPRGRVLSPRGGADACFGSADIEVVYEVADPEGEIVTATVLLGGVPLGAPAQIDTPDDGSFAEQRLAVPAATIAMVAEGLRTLTIELVDADGGRSEVNAGAPIPVDRTAPDVAIVGGPTEGTCYDPDTIPEPVFEVDDNLDPAPLLDQEVQSNACGRTLVVTATDACGNVGTTQRGYREAVPAEVTINGVEEGALVANAQIDWDINNPVNCANGVTARVRLPDGDVDDYVEGSLLDSPGNHALNLTVLNCRDAARQLVVNFTVNAPPVGVAGGPYVVEEGAGLQIDASASRAPEPNDAIATYEWDFGAARPGGFQPGGALEAFPTDEDGEFDAQLRVTDSLGEKNVVSFQVTVTDVDPVADAGGPYEIPQGAPLILDGSGSRPGSAADPIANYTWIWNDGTPDTSGPDQAMPTHRFPEDGVFNVRLVVDDEDSSAEAIAVVRVTDVSPTLDGIDTPDEVYEIAPMRFTARATAGAPGDAILQYEWDFGDGSPVRVTPGPEVDHQFESAGNYTIEVRVVDPDSVASLQLEVEVREITLPELVLEIDRRIGRNAAASPRAAAVFAAANTATWMTNANWGEAQYVATDLLQRRGNTMLALGEVLDAMVTTTEQGDGYQNLMWATSRQLLREVRSLRDEIIDADNDVDVDHPSVVRSDAFLASAEEVYNTIYQHPDTGEDVTFKEVVDDPIGSFLALDVQARALEAFFFLTDAVDPCNAPEYNGFRVPQFGDRAQQVAAADPVNTQLHGALGDLENELRAYRATPGAPGADAVAVAITTIQELRQFTARPVAVECDDLACLSDEQALDLALGLADLAAVLFEAEAAGAWVRNWQNCLILATRFRVELSLLRVEFVCGPNARTARAARDTQEVGLSLVDDRRDTAALAYYMSPEVRCVIYDTYNECLVPAFPGTNPSREPPIACE